jgi:hypothetical protein
MNHLLKAMGLWIWGLIAVGLAVSLVSVSYRMLSVYRSHDLAPRPSSESRVELASPPALRSETTEQAPAVLKDTDADASRRRAIAARETITARNAAQANQDALNSLEAAERQAPPTNESKPIREFQGYSSISLDKFKATQSAYEAALSRGAYKEAELVRVFRALFQLAVALQQPAKAIEYGEKANDLGAWSARTNAMITIR